MNCIKQELDETPMPSRPHRQLLTARKSLELLRENTTRANRCSESGSRGLESQLKSNYSDSRTQYRCLFMVTSERGLFMRSCCVARSGDLGDCRIGSAGDSYGSATTIGQFGKLRSVRVICGRSKLDARLLRGSVVDQRTRNLEVVFQLPHPFL